MSIAILKKKTSAKQNISGKSGKYKFVINKYSPGNPNIKFSSDYKSLFHLKIRILI